MIFFIHWYNDQAQGQAGFTARSFEAPTAFEKMMDFEKPPCPLVPCSALLANYDLELILKVNLSTNGLEPSSPTELTEKLAAFSITFSGISM